MFINHDGVAAQVICCWALCVHRFELRSLDFFDVYRDLYETSLFSIEKILLSRNKNTR